MKIDIFTFCDSAKEYNGKLVVVGTFNTLLVSKFPASGMAFDLALRIVFEPNDIGKHNMTINVCDKDNGKSITNSLQSCIEITDRFSETKLLNIVLNCVSLSFEKPGEYELTVEIDDVKYKSSLFVKPKQS